MIDVHSPDHGIHGVRDFFVHLLTITVGLLIALGLEASVEAMHHRHQRMEAEETIRREMQENRAKVQELQVGVVKAHTNMVGVLLFLMDRRANKPGDITGLSLEFHEEPLKNTGWQTASATGVLTYINYDKVQKYAGAYQEQRLFEEAQERALQHLEELDGYLAQNKDPRNISVQDAEAAIPDVRHVIADIAAMNDIGRGLMGAYNDALKE